MSFAADLYSLLAVADVTALVGDRIYPAVAPVGAERPYIVWRRNGGDSLPIMNPTSVKREFVEVVISAFAETFDAAEAVSLAARAAVLARSGSAKGTCSPPFDGFEPETKLVAVSFQARLFYRA